MIPVFSPSYKRADGVMTHKWLPTVTYCVHAFEAASYRDRGFKVLEIPDAKRGNIARVRNWILDYAKEQGFGEFLIVDDDVRSFNGRFHHSDVRKFTGADAEEMIEKGFQLAREWGARIWGVNPTSDKGAYREYTPFTTLSYVSGSFMGFLNGFDLRFDENLPLKEDFDMSIQEIRETRRILRINFLHLIKADHQNKGGCAAYRKLKKERAQMDALIRKWGSRIVKEDTGASSVHRKKEAGVDINPKMTIPIKGV